MTKELVHIADIGLSLKDEREIFLIHDRNAAWVAEEVAKSTSVKGVISIDTSEELKTLETVEAIERQLIEAEASRSAIIIAIGGGITTDLAGFAAAIYKRGIRWCAFPTTLLGQVDAAIGGKTGANLDGYKNMIGAFHMPESTFICAEVLKTLPEKQLKSGMAEMLKTFLLADEKAYLKALEDGPTQELIAKAAAIKEAVVERDPFEKGERACLNLGHTFGHAIEHEARGSITHGEAVAMGILLAARLGESIGMSEKGLTERLKADFAKAGLPVECPYSLTELKEAMAKDKKSGADGKVKFVIPARPGEYAFKQLNPNDLHFDTK